MNRPIVLKHNKYIKIFLSLNSPSARVWVTFFKILLSYHKRELLWWVGSHCINLPLFNTDSQLLLSKKQSLIFWKHCFNTESIIHISIQNNRKTTSFSSHSSSLWDCHISNKSISRWHDELTCLINYRWTSD